MNRRVFLQMAASGIAASASGAGRASASPGAAGGTAIFPFGCHIYREPSLPLEQLLEDMPLLKKLGFNMVKIQESWAVDEKVEGVVDLSRVAQVVGGARTNGLKVYFGVTMEQAPAWFWKKFPDAYLTYNTGERHFDQLQYVIPSDGKPGPCWHHPEGRAAAIRFLHSVGREIGRYENVAVWNVWQEIGFGPTWPNKLGFCYCDHSLAAFRVWLRKKYGSLGAVNAMWKSAYADFEDIVPPRAASDLPPFVDFRVFMEDEYFAEVLRWKSAALKASDPLQRPVFAHADDTIPGSAQPWRQAEALDFFGCSNYPAWRPFGEWDLGRASAGGSIDAPAGQNAELWNSILLKFDTMRCATPGGKIWAAEFQGGPVVRGLQRGRVPSADDIDRWVLGSLAAGVQGLCFWNHRAEIFWREEFGFGLLELEGNTITPRAEAAGRLAKAINRHAELFSEGTVPQASVAILVSEELYQFHKATFHEAGTASPLDHFTHTIRGLYKSLWDRGIGVDFLLDSDLPARGERYKAILLTFPVALDSELVSKLCAYVERGGVLLSEACPGRLTPHGLVSPSGMPPALEQLFGAKHEDLVIVREPHDGSVWTPSPAAYGDTVPYIDLDGADVCAGKMVAPAYMLQTFAPTTGTAILKAGRQVAGVRHAFGQGTAYLVGTLLGHALLSYGDQRNGTFVADLLADHGVLSDSVGKLQRKRRSYRGQQAWFLFNTTTSNVEEDVAVGRALSVEELMGGSLDVKDAKVHVSVAPMQIRCLVLNFAKGTAYAS